MHKMEVNEVRIIDVLLDHLFFKYQISNFFSKIAKFSHELEFKSIIFFATSNPNVDFFFFNSNSKFFAKFFSFFSYICKDFHAIVFFSKQNGIKYIIEWNAFLGK